MMISYKNAVHRNFGQYIYQNGMFIMPIWTQTFCNDLIAIAEEWKDKFDFDPKYSDDWLSWHRISRILVEDYGEWFKHELIPVLAKEWFFMDVVGIYSPFILRYRTDRNVTMKLHTDESVFTTNIKLNNDYEGGDLYFPKQGFSLKDVPAGHAVIFPSQLTHPHVVTDPLRRGTKYVVTSFTWPPAWNDQTGYRFR